MFSVAQNSALNRRVWLELRPSSVGKSWDLVKLKKGTKAGKIANIASMGGKIYTPLGAWYHAAKHAVEGRSDCLRFELEPFNPGESLAP